MRSFWTFMPVTPTMSKRGRDSKSISSTFSSSRTTSCEAGTNPASAGSAPVIIVLRLSPG